MQVTVVQEIYNTSYKEENFFPDLLHVQAAPNNGTPGRLYSFLKKPPVYNETVAEIKHQSCLSHVQIKQCSTNCPVGFFCLSYSFCFG